MEPKKQMNPALDPNHPVVKRMLEKERRENEDCLYIGRVPPNTKAKFLELCTEKEYKKDYGFLLRDIVDFYTCANVDSMKNQIQMLKAEMEELKSFISEMVESTKPDKEEPEGTTMCDGNKKNIPPQGK